MRRTINIKVLAVVIMLTVLFSGVIVSADTKKPDPSKVDKTLALCRYTDLSSDSTLMDIKITNAFSYDFIINYYSPYEVSGCKTPIIEIYDKDLKLLKSSDKGSLTLFLEKGNYYVFVYSPDGRSLNKYDLTARYTYSLDVQVKKPGSSEYMKQAVSGDCFSSTHGGYWDSYSALNGSSMTFDISIKDLPSGRFDLEYEWYEKTGSSSKLINKGSRLSIDVSNSTTYSCKISDKKSLSSFYVYFMVTGNDDLKFEDGSRYDYEIKAFKPSEQRVSSLKPLANAGKL